MKLGATPSRGIWVAASVLGAMWSASMTGCLVTDPIELPETEDFPPSVTSDESALSQVPPTPVNEVVRAVREELGNEIAFPVVIRDPNVDQVLEAQAYLECTDVALQAFFLRDIEPVQATTADVDRTVRTRTAALPVAMLGSAGKCCKVEFLVSSDFQFANPREPETPGDLGTATWWIAYTDSSNPFVEMTTCP